MIFLKKIKEDLDKEIRNWYIREALKSNFGLSFKRISSRPSNQDSYKNKLIRKLFAIEYLHKLSEEYLVVNVDEVLFSNKTKTNYSWARKGEAANIHNLIFGYSISIITSITSSGQWFRSHLKSNNNSSQFILFMKKLVLWIHHDLDYSIDKTIIILDNCKIHKSKQTLDFLKKWKALIVFFPPYTPEMCPIELVFHLLKKRLLKQTGRCMSKLNYKSTEREIKEVFSTISKEEITNCYEHCMKIIKLYAANSEYCKPLCS